ncbi:MAG: hypothetical protein KAH28_10420 [Algiphilus sp.]|nr:hypothetical protein [Algiphilus sp.]
MAPNTNDPMTIHAHWVRTRAGAEHWRLGRDRRTVADDDGPIALCEREGDARFILAACAGRAEPRDPSDVASPPIWARDEGADGTEPERRLRDGNEHPIITLFVAHPRSAYNEDFILISRNDALGA